MFIPHSYIYCNVGFIYILYKHLVLSELSERVRYKQYHFVNVLNYIYSVISTNFSVNFSDEITWLLNEHIVIE